MALVYRYGELYYVYNTDERKLIIGTINSTLSSLVGVCYMDNPKGICYINDENTLVYFLNYKYNPGHTLEDFHTVEMMLSLIKHHIRNKQIEDILK